MQMTPEARAWLDDLVRRILAKNPVGDPERAGVTYELMSHLHGAGEASAQAAGRTQVAREDLEAALRESGGEEGLAAAFVKPLARPIQRVLFWRRLGALAVDGAILGIAITFVHEFFAFLLRPLVGTATAPTTHPQAMFYLFPEGFHDATLGLVGQVIIALASAATFLLYFTWFEGHEGRTLGKRAFDLRVVRVDGRPMTYGAALKRNLVKAAPFLLVLDTLAMVLFLRKDRQRVSDKVADTIVVRS